MLWTILLVLLVLWALGLVSGYTLGGFVHVLLVIAVDRPDHPVGTRQTSGLNRVPPASAAADGHTQKRKGLDKGVKPHQDAPPPPRSRSS